jgi:hypothetical protein
VRQVYNSKQVLSAYKVSYDLPHSELFFHGEWASAQQNEREPTAPSFVKNSFGSTALVWPKGSTDPILLALEPNGQLKKITRDGTVSDVLMNLKPLIAMSEGRAGSLYVVTHENEIYEFVFDKKGSYK